MRQQPKINQPVMDSMGRHVGTVVEVQRGPDQEGQPSYLVTVDLTDDSVVGGLQVLGSVGSLN